MFQMHKICSFYYRHSYNMANVLDLFLRLSNLDNVPRKFPESFQFIYRELLFPHEDMFLLLFPECFKIHTLESFHFHTKICFSFFTNQMIKC